MRTTIEKIESIFGWPFQNIMLTERQKAVVLPKSPILYHFTATKIRNRNQPSTSLLYKSAALIESAKIERTVIVMGFSAEGSSYFHWDRLPFPDLNKEAKFAPKWLVQAAIPRKTETEMGKGRIEANADINAFIRVNWVGWHSTIPSATLRKKQYFFFGVARSTDTG